MENFDNRAKQTELELDEEAILAIREGRAMPTPEFLADNPEARVALLDAFRGAEELKQGLNLLEEDEKQKFVSVFTEALESTEKSQGRLLIEGLMALGFANIMFEASGPTVPGDRPDLYALAGLVATAVLIHRSYKVMTRDSITNPTTQDRIKAHLEGVLTS